MRKKICVEFYDEDDGNCQQLFKVVNEQRYYARGNGGSWYTVSDPLGYAELSHLISDDFEFIICDESGKQLFSSGNKNSDTNFPFLRQACTLEWQKMCKKISVTKENESAEFWFQSIGGSTISPLNKWLLSFKDPEVYGQLAKDYDENWIYFGHETIKEEELHSFCYCGRRINIASHLKKHSICGVTWNEFYSGDYFMASQFNEKNQGTMYAKRDAICLVKEALKDIYMNEDKISYVEPLLPHCENKVTYEKAAELLLKQNYNRKKVMELIAQELSGDRHFYANRGEIEAVYGKDYVPSYMTF